MTVCIANIAARSKAIVMVSDKAVTYESNTGMPALVADTGARKFFRIGDTFWYMLVGGNPSFAFDVVRNAERILARMADKNLPESLGGMMYCLKSSYQKTRDKAVEDRVLRPRLFDKNLVTARSSNLQPLSDEVFLAITTTAKEFNPECRLLVCGFDAKNKPHIFTVTNPGKSDLHDITGFYAVGKGAITAIARLLILEARIEDRLELALYQAFDAKVNAEIVETVGYNWDVEVLVPGYKAIPVPNPVARVIERAYEDFPLTPIAFGQSNAKSTHKGMVLKKKRCEAA